MPTVREPPSRLVAQAGVGLLAVVALLAVLAATVGLTAAGWLIGVAYGATLTVTLIRAVGRSGRDRLGPADAVTLTRAVLVGGLTALVADSFSVAAPVPVMVALASVALALDAVDGRVARRTGTVTAVGARFDMEVDAFTVLVLALYDMRLLGGWVLLIGAARYLLLAAGWLLPWLRAPTPPRWWAKVVAATQGVVLTVVMAQIVPGPVAALLAVGALLLLAESFGRQVWWLQRHARPAAPATARSPARRIAAALTTGAAAVLVWCALVGPNDPSLLGAPAFLRVPVEAVVAFAVILAVPARPGRMVAVAFGAFLAVMALIKLLDFGFRSALDRPFNPLSDFAYAESFLELLTGSIGRIAALAVAVAIGFAALALLVFLPLAARRLTRLAGRHRATSLRFTGAFAAIWLVGAVVGLQVAPGTPLAAASTGDLAYQELAAVGAGLADRRAFADELAHRPTPVAHQQLPLAGLRGKDVLMIYVESYGRVAVEDPTIAPGVTAVLKDGTSRLAAAGFTAESAFLSSPTFGGISWLAHATVQSGMWVDSQQRYDQLMASGRPTLTSLFGAAGWRTVLDVPANQRDWPEASTFYRANQVYDARSTGYRGPPFAFDTAPDQYTLAHFQRTELAPTDRRPVMAEIDLVTSHTPWLPLPRLVEWPQVGDGSVFHGMPEQSATVDEVWPDPTLVRVAYGRTIEYTMTAVISFVQTFGTDNLVVIVLGDHQPAPVVSGDGASRDVPVSIISRDPAVFAAIDEWGWQSGLRPDPAAPVWRMDDFHGRFLDAFSS